MSYGFYLEGSDNNSITYNQVENSITGSSAFNIYLTSSDGNEIFRNSFLDDGGAYDSETNTWFDTSENEGNWWGNWQAPENTTDFNNDGVLDNFYYFTGGQDNYPLSLVTLKAPDNQACTNDNTVTLKWTIPVLPVYIVQVDNDSNFSTLEYENTISENITEFDLQRTENTETSELGDGTYYWRVKARTSNSDYETTSPVWKFILDKLIPQPLSPADESNTNENAPTFSWENKVVTDNYEIWIDNKADWSTAIIDNTVDNMYTLVTQLAENVYYWRVRGYQGAHVSIFSPTLSFRVDVTPPQVPSLVSPPDGGNINDNTPTLDWGTVSEDSLPVLYRVYVAIDPSFSFVGRDSGWILDDNWEVTAVLPDGVYYWRVCAKDNAGNAGENSSARSFRVDTVAPAAPQLVSPISGENTNDKTPLLDWNTVSENSLPVLYYAAMSDNSDFPYENENSGWITADNWEVTPELPDGVWYWHVRAKDNAGNVGPFSPTWTLTIVTPPWTGWTAFSMLDLYTVNVDKNLDLNQGSKLVVKFYTYMDAFENENVIETFTTPPTWHVEENESARHPEGVGVKKARLNLTTDDTGNVIETIASFTVRRVDLEARFLEIPFYWSMATTPEEKLELETEFMEIPFYWSGAPP